MPSVASAVMRLELGRGERFALGRPLHLDELALPRHDDVHVDLGLAVLLVGEVEAELLVDQADADRRDVVERAAPP